MELFETFKTVKDPRKNINKKDDFIDILFLTISAVISGALGWKDIKEFGDEKLEWLRQFREFKNGIPVDDTIARVIRLIKPDEFNQCFIDWVNTVRKENNQPHIAICVFSSTSITNSHLASITQYHSCRSLNIIHADHFKLILGVVIWLRL